MNYQETRHTLVTVKKISEQNQKVSLLNFTSLFELLVTEFIARPMNFKNLQADIPIWNTLFKIRFAEISDHNEII